MLPFPFVVFYFLTISVSGCRGEHNHRRCDSNPGPPSPVWLNTAKDPQRTAKEHYGLSCRKLAPIGRGNFILRLSHQKHRLSVADWKALSEPQRQRVRHAVFSLACEGDAAWHAKDRKGPQRTTKEHYTGPQRTGNTAKDPQRTAKEHYGLSCRKLAPIIYNFISPQTGRQ